MGETWVLRSDLAGVKWDEEGSEYPDEEGRLCAEPGLGRHRERRGDYLNGGWVTLFDMTAQLAQQVGAENVRLSVRFDQW